ncbi:6012_t:CDS:2 [Acaulospora morrowiae]|uniref:Deoxyuridine 5'-triphosphate nucleotidohydrolase n=1 Tax=Acaulospora morrowiae TaxID=94023 RepID=A0A9N9I7C5_9GLOM|nr:6012_t:CDS:2 [Acaulospora morrowiae]
MSTVEIREIDNNKCCTSFTDSSMELRVKRLSNKAKLPVRGSKLAAGYDLYSAANIVIPAKGKAVVPTDISIAVPLGTYGRVAPRSGLASKHFLDCGAGVVDADYRGPLGVLMFNFNDVDYHGIEGERIAQLILERIYNPCVIEVESLDETDRGSGGFGSTGKYHKEF